MNKQKGFTLIELVVVLVILGILAAFAIPRFYSFSQQANTAVVNGLVGAVSSAMVTAHGAALALGQTAATGTITMEGTTVALAYGYPTAAGIAAAVNVSANITVAASGLNETFTVTTATTPANCQAVYTPATSATVPASVAPVVGGC